MTKWTRFWKNLKVLAHALATEDSICVTQPKNLRPFSRQQIKSMVIEANKEKITSKRKVKTQSEIQWPEGEITFDQLCQANINFSKDEIRKALGQKMEQSRKVLL